jgi:large subunit ribosomal protein L29
MKYTEIKDLTVDELVKRKAKVSEEMFVAQMKHSLGQLSNPLEIRGSRRDLARINTALGTKLGEKKA